MSTARARPHTAHAAGAARSPPHTDVLGGSQGAPLHKAASIVYNVCMEKPWAVLDTSFWVIGHRVDVLSYLFRFFTVCVPDAVRHEVLSPDSRYPMRVYGYQEFFRLLEAQGALHIRNP